MRLLGAIASASLALVASVGDAHAGDEVPLRTEDLLSMGLAVDATSAPRTTAVGSRQLASTLSATVRVRPSWVVAGEGAVSATSSRFGDAPAATTTRASNPLVSTRWTAHASPGGEGFALFLGAIAGAPLVTVPSGGITSSAAAEQADRVALGAAGPRGAWRWARNAVPLVASARGSYTFGSFLGPLRATLDVEPGVLLSVNRDPSRAALVLSAEAALVQTVVAPYVALSVVTSSRAFDARDFAQTGCALGVRHDLGSFFAWSEGRLQLDGPQGVTDRYATFWGATLGLGTRL